MSLKDRFGHFLTAIFGHLTSQMKKWMHFLWSVQFWNVFIKFCWHGKMFCMVTFLPMLPKLVRTYPHKLRSYRTTIFEIDTVKSSFLSIKFLSKLTFSQIFCLFSLLLFILKFAETTAVCTKYEETWFWPWQKMWIL